MKTENLEELKNQVLYFVKNDMLGTPEFKEMLNKFIYDEEDATTEKNQDFLYKSIRYLMKNKALANEVQSNMLMVSFICYLTSPKMSLKSRLQTLKAVHNGGVVKRIYPKKRGWKIIDGNGNLIKVSLVSKSMPSLTKEIFDRLESGTERMGYCHYDSMQLVRCLLNDEARVVTGNVAYYYEGDSYSHSWIEYKSKKEHKDMVLDFTMNAIMPKEDYYRLRKPEVLSVVSREQIKEAIEDLRLFDEKAPLQNIDNKVLFLFFDELVEISKQKLEGRNQTAYEEPTQKE